MIDPDNYDNLVTLLDPTVRDRAIPHFIRVVDRENPQHRFTNYMSEVTERDPPGFYLNVTNGGKSLQVICVCEGEPPPESHVHMFSGYAVTAKDELIPSSSPSHRRYFATYYELIEDAP